MKIRRLKTIAVISITPILLLTMISLTTQPAHANECQAFISTTPQGADVYVDGRLIGQSPILHFVGQPFSADIRVEMEGFETWTIHIDVPLNEHRQVNAVLTPLQMGNGGDTTVTKTVTNTVTTISPTTITATTTATITATTTVAVNTITVTSAVTTATTSTITTEITEQTGLPTEVTYGAIGIAVIAIIAASIIATRKRT